MMAKKNLQQLYAEHHGKVSDKWSIYLTEHDRIFNAYREKPVRLLEIGTQNGGSLEIWSKYFPVGQVFVGCDINPDCKRLSHEDSRIEVVVGDANIDSVQSSILEKSSSYDLIIDDGSHLSSDIVKSFARYFPFLDDDGTYVVEDLHCSYWKEFEGGLFDTYSSIAFFKRLVDIVNHEHWGGDIARTDMLKGFFGKYGFSIDEDTLRHIHSVEFINSICVIRKCQPEHNVLGKRNIVGSHAQVMPEILELRSKPAHVLGKTNNEWVTRGMPVDEGLLLRQNDFDDIKHKLAERDEMIATILSSTSWKLTAPIRVLGSVKRAVVRLSGRLKRVSGSLKPYLLRALHEPLWGVRMLRKVLTILRSSGLDGVKKAVIKVHRARFEYQEWIYHYDTLTDEARETIRNRIDEFEHLPLISLVMPVYNPNPKWLVEAIESVRKQIYPNWELCIAVDASTDPTIRQVLESHQNEDKRIKVVYCSNSGHIDRTSNSALEQTSGDFVALMDHGDAISEHTLFWVVHTINQHPDAEVLYSDEDKIDESGKRYDPYFKCELNYELLLAQNMICHLGVYRRHLLQQIGGFRSGFEGAQEYDLVLRALEHISPHQVVHIPRVLYHRRAITGSTVQSIGEKNYASEARRKAVAEHLQRRGVAAQVLPAPEAPDFNRVRFASPEPLPLVSIIIPTRDRADLLSVCLNSILERSSYPNYEIIIIDNGSVESDTKQLFERLPKDRCHVVCDASPFNFSALNNLGVRVARGEMLCLMNNDIEILTTDWLEEMVSWALRPDVGCVGARLWYPDGQLQHGGVILGIGGAVGHSQRHLMRGARGYFHRAVLHQELSAVTAACLLVRRTVFEHVNGLDEDLAVAFNDIDFCLRVREAGYHNVWTPYAEMNHHESASRGYDDVPEKQARFNSELQFMQERWGGLFMHDPAYSPNLTLEREDFSYAWPPRVELV